MTDNEDEAFLAWAGRPSYSRMISAELTRSPRARPNRSKRRSNNKVRNSQTQRSNKTTSSSSSSNDTEHDNQTDSEEYFSAEDQSEQEPSATAVQNVRTSPNKLHRGKLERNILRCEIRALMDICLDDTVVDEVNSDCSNGAEFGSVPSLIYLCSHYIKKRSKQCSYHNTPAGLSKVLTKNTDQRWLSSARFNWMTSMLTHLELQCQYEVQRNIQECNRKGFRWTTYKLLIYSLKWDKNGIYSLFHQRSSRTIWTHALTRHVRTSSSFVISDIFKQYGCHTLAVTDYQSLRYEDGESCKKSELSIMQLVSLFLDQVIAPLIPGSEKSTKISKRWKAQISYWKNFLKKRFPIITEYFFEEALPYVWWARGNFNFAEKCFLDVIAAHKHVRHKALYYNELGRMFSSCTRHHDKARHYFRKSADIALLQPYLTDAKLILEHPGIDDKTFIELQPHILMAGLSDIGCINADSATSAHKYWSFLIELSKNDKNVIHAATTSILCAHSGYSVDGTDWFDFTSRILSQKIACEQPYYYNELALVLAMQGKQEESDDAMRYCYSQHCVTCDDMLIAVPFRNMTHTTTKGNAYQPIIDQVHAAHRAKRIEPIKLLWRTCPSQVIYTGYRTSQLGDFPCQTGLQFWIDGNGELTGDFGTTLPPMPQMRLDPYTGEVKHKVLPEDKFYVQRADGFHRSEENDNAISCKEVLHNPPKMQEIYSSDDGCSAYLYLDYTIAKESKSVRQECATGAHYRYSPQQSRIDSQHFVAIYKNANEETTKISLTQLLTRQFLQECLKRVHELYEPYAENNKIFSKQWLDLICEICAMCKKTKKIFKLKEVSDRTESFLSKCTEDHKEYSKLLRKEMYSLAFEPTFMLKKICTIETKVFMVVSCWGHELTDKKAIHIVLDCSDESTFQSPYISMSFSRLAFDIRPFDGLLKQDTVAVSSPALGQQVQTLLLYRPGTHPMTTTLQIADLTGYALHTALDAISKTDLERSSNKAVLCMIGQDFYGYDPALPRKIIRHSDKAESESLGPNILKVVTAAQLMFVLSDKGLFVLNSDLKLLNWIFDEATISNIVLDGEQQYIYTEQTELTLLTDFTAPNSLIRAGFDSVKRVYLALRTQLLVVEIEHQIPDYVRIVYNSRSPGIIKDICHISDSDGYLMVARAFTGVQHIDIDYYSETLYHYSYQHGIQGVLTNLGPGPHNFTPIYMEPSLERVRVQKGYEEGWHVYFRDGHGAICCFTL